MKKNNQLPNPVTKPLWFLLLTVCLFTNSTVVCAQEILVDLPGQVYTTMQSENSSSQKLQKIIHLEGGEKMLGVTLRDIARQSGLKLSYSEQLLPWSKEILIKSGKMTVKQALWNVLENTSLRFGVSSGGQLFFFEKKTEHIEEGLQVVTVTGQVTDAQIQEALPGVNILIKSTDRGTSTNLDGEFSIEVESLQDTLVFTYIGYETQEVPINERTELDVALQPQTIAGAELVVTALGIERDTRSLGYSTSQVTSEEVSVNRSTNFIESLQGKVAGVNISSMATGAGGSSRINIRGQSSFSGSNQPLIVVDGTPINNTSFQEDTQGENTADAGDGLLSINPDNIESMNILKGGAAAALYGSRAKDGVIMITTKNNAAGRGIGVTFSSNIQFHRAIDNTDFQYQYGQGEKGVRPTAPFPNSGVWSFGEKIEPGMTQILFDGVEVPYQPQRNQITDFYSGGYTATNTISLATGDENSGLNLSISQLNTNDITPNSGFDRKNISLGFTQEITPNFDVSGSINYSRETHTNPPQVESQDMTSVRSIYTMANTMPLDIMEQNQRDENGNEIVWSRFRNRTNPYISVNDAFNDVERDRLFGNISMRYNFTDWLYLQGRVGQDYYSRDQELNFPSLMAGIAPAPEGFINGTFTRDERVFREINADALLGAFQQINESFSVDLTLGGNIMRQRSDRNSILGQDFIVPWLYTIENSRVQTPLYNYSERQVNSLFAAADFSYNDYLFLSLTARNDWFSTLSPSERSVLYPSVSSSFVFTEVIDQLPDWLNFGKVRAGFSEVGSDTDVAPFSQTLTYVINSSLFQGPSSSQPIGSIGTNIIPNPNLRPMRVKEYEFGINLQMFNRVNFDVTYYNKKSIDQILNAAVSNTSGYSARLVNVGESVNRGIEVLLDITAIERPSFLWNVTFNGSYNTSEVLKLGEDGTVSIGGRIRQVVGEPMGEIYDNGYQRDEQGRIIFNPNNGLPLSTPNDIRLGNAIPKWIGGISNTFRYKDFSLYALVDFKLGHDLISDAERDFTRHGKQKKTLVGREQGFVVGEGVTPDGSPNTTQVDIQTFYEADANIYESHVYNAGFWKLRQVSLGYDLTNLMPDNFPLQSLTLSAVANNVFTIKTWTPNLDPEMVNNDTGVQEMVLPLTRSFGFNLKVEI